MYPNKTRAAAKSVPAALTISGIISLGTTVILSALITNLLLTEKISWETAGYWIMCIILLASYLGAKSAYALTKRQRMVISIMAGILYWGILLAATALFFGGNYQSVPETAALIAAGSMSAALIYLPEKEKIKRKYKKAYR